LEFAQGQIVRDREFYKHLYSYAVGFIAFMILVAGYFQYSSVSQMRADMKGAVDSELIRDKAEIETMRAQATQASLDAQATVTRELANVRTEVQKRIDTEFRSDNISALIAKAAKERTEKELTGIIRSEASVQVEKGIKEQGPAIQKVVEDQTKQAVKELEPTIKATVDRATQNEVKTSVEPIQTQLKTYADYIRIGTIGTLATLAKADDRHAFDYLLQLALGSAPESANLDLRKLADSVAGGIIRETELGLDFENHFKQPQTPEAMKKFMSSPNPTERAAAVDSYPPNDRTILPILFTMIQSDASIRVLHKAVIRFNSLTNQSFEFWKTKDILDWWDKNRSAYQ
jgi:hypothetical protein